MRSLRRRHKILATVALGLAAIAAGDALGRHSVPPLAPGLAAAHANRAAPITAPTSGADLLQRHERLIARTVARCETAALWKWLEDRPPGERSEFKSAVLTELYERLGTQAFEQSLKMTDPGVSAEASDILLSYLADKDPWDAMRRYDEHRSAMPHGWGSTAMTSIVAVSFGQSADLAVAAIGRNTGSPEAEGFVASFPEGFDFKKLADFLGGPDGNFNVTPMNLLQAWGDRDPATAAAWLRDHPHGIDAAGWATEFEATPALVAIANSTAPGRSAALAALAAAPPETLRTWWNDVTVSHQELSPQLLDAATAMGRREDYLTASLLNTRISDSLPAAWSAVPEAERPALLTAAMRQWTATTPLEAKARDSWRARTQAQWAAMPGR